MIKSFVTREAGYLLTKYNLIIVLGFGLSVHYARISSGIGNLALNFNCFLVSLLCCMLITNQA